VAHASARTTLRVVTNLSPERGARFILNLVETIDLLSPTPYSQDTRRGPRTTGPANHMFGMVAAAKIDLVGQWDLKIEGHFMDGFGTPNSFRGFYPQDNPAGFKPKTNMLVIRTSWNF
jgi:hypothetical protein